MVILLKDGITQPISSDLERVEDELTSITQSDFNLLYNISFSLLKAGGKRLRPTLVLLSGRFFNYHLKSVLPIAAAIELLHMATLIHDDIIDDSKLRRGEPTVNHRWGKRVAVLNGDLLYAHAMKLMTKVEDRELVSELVDVILIICKGEMQQFTQLRSLDQDLNSYLNRIEQKTALLLAKSCQLGARACGADNSQQQILFDYGLNLGIAFQIINDLKDLINEEAELGKPPGDDLRQGIMTLPIIHALQSSPERAVIADVLSTKDPEERLVQRAIDLIRETDAAEETIKFARGYTHRAYQQLYSLPDLPARRSLFQLLNYISGQDYQEDWFLDQKISY